MADQESLETLVAIEQALAEHRAFGDSTYILCQLEVCLRRRLNSVSTRLPVAGALLEVLTKAEGSAVYPLIGETVVRCAILHAHSQMEADAPYALPLGDCEKIFKATIHHIQQGDTGSLLDDGGLERLGPEPYHGWLWTEEHSDDLFGRSFRYLLQQKYQAFPRTPGAHEIAMLKKGAMLLQELLPALTPSALRHARTIACVPSSGGWQGIASSSQFHLGGTIFLGGALQNPWWVAEHLFHESLHQKLYDFRHGHSLLELDLPKEEAGKVCSPWNSPALNKANQWDVHRVIAAFHVYVHLALLAFVAEQRASQLEHKYGPFHGMIEGRTAFERAIYLGEKLKEQCWNELGIAGQRLTDWLIASLEFMSNSPPPKGASIHLCLDLYEKEAGRIAATLRECESSPSTLSQRLVPLGKEEVQNTRHLLSAINATEALKEFDNSVAQYTDEELGTRFPDLRRTIQTSLVRASVDRYRLTEAGDKDELARRMMERASQRVHATLAGYPPGVADAKCRATELQFNISCNDEVGRLLAVLTGAVPAGGRILEIGTGAAVGTAWMTAGLGERWDVELITVEVDPRLSAAAKTSEWPAYVRIVTASALEELPTLGMFNLVFVDAAPVKYGHIESVLDVLQPGGLLIVDDVEPDDRTTEVQRAEKTALRWSLLNHPRLFAAHIEVSRGVILATKCAAPAKSTPRPLVKTIVA